MNSLAIESVALHFKAISSIRISSKVVGSSANTTGHSAGRLGERIDPMKRSLVILFVSMLVLSSWCGSNEGPSGTPTCPGDIIGDLTQPSSIEIHTLEPGVETIRGIANNVDARSTRVSGWARTDRYYSQPFRDRPFTSICSNGSWEYSTHPWDQVVVLLVDDNYVLPPDASIDYHPSTDPGVLAWAEIPASRRIEFSDHTWWVKHSEPHTTGPGPCVFSSGEDSVHVDDLGHLHLRITQQNDNWRCAEVVHDGPLGFGTYTFRISTTMNLDINEVFSGFIFESLTREIDIEFSRSLSCSSPENAQYVVQPYANPGNLRCLEIPLVESSSHRIEWYQDRIVFWSWEGFGPFPPDSNNVISTWTYSGPDIPPSDGRERMRFNLWLVNGMAPPNGGSEVVVHSFEFESTD